VREGTSSRIAFQLGLESSNPSPILAYVIPPKRDTARSLAGSTVPLSVKTLSLTCARLIRPNTNVFVTSTEFGGRMSYEWNNCGAKVTYQYARQRTNEVHAYLAFKTDGTFFDPRGLHIYLSEGGYHVQDIHDNY